MTALTYAAQSAAFGRQVQWLVEIDLDRCDEVYTQGSCTASDQGDGSRCWYSFPTCQDETNYNRTTKTWRFCLNTVAWPDNAYQVHPLLKKFVGVPQQVDPKKLDTHPEKITLEFLFDWQPPQQDHDKGDGYFNTSKTGEFWRNLIARNPNYVNRPLRVYRGFAAPGYPYSEFQQVGPEYIIRGIAIGRDSAKVTAESPLAKLKNRQAPWAISKDNTLVNDEVAGSTTWEINDGTEWPDPANYAQGGGGKRNHIFARCEDEIVRVTAVTGNTLTVVRGVNGTQDQEHPSGSKVTHILCIGTDPGTAIFTGVEVTEVMQDLLEWAGVAAADVDDTSFDRVLAGAWPDKDIRTNIEKPQKISALMARLRDARGILLFIDDSGKWSCEAMAPGDTPTDLTEDNFVDGSVEVIDDEEARVTRCALFFDPTKSGATKPEDFGQVVIVVDGYLESANMYGDVREAAEVNAWIDPSLAVSKIRNLCRRVISYRRTGVRTIRFSLEAKDASLNVGNFVTVKTRFLVDLSGAQAQRQGIIISKKEVKESVTQYRVVDFNAVGRYAKIGPDTMEDDYDTAGEADRVYAYWGDSVGRVGATKLPGYVYW